MVEVDGRRATFTPPPKARYLIGDFTDWKERPIEIFGPLILEFPEGAYVEYAFMDEHKKPFADPDQDTKAHNPWWRYPRAFALPRHAPGPVPKSRTLRGEVHRHVIDSSVLGTQRRYYVYESPEPPVAEVYVQDGVAYYRTGRFHQVADALWRSGAIDPVRLIFVEPVDRNHEYWFNERYAAFLREELPAEIAQTYGKTARRGLWGASLGGLASAWMALLDPGLYDFVGLQSAALKAKPGGAGAYKDPEWLLERYLEAQTLPERIYQEVGRLEWLLAANRRFAAMLADCKVNHAYRERASGHNWYTWRQGLAPGLRFLLGAA